MTDHPAPGTAPIALRAIAVVTGIAVAGGVVLRLMTGSVLWLDEALSVNIARLPVGELLDALRHDGSPPFYYLLLHFWMELFGSSDVAVRSLSSVCALAVLPVSFWLGRRFGGNSAGWMAVAAVAANPFLIRYATETRMYALVVLVVLLGLNAILGARERPTPARLSTVGVLTGLLALTHYWALFLIATGVVVAVIAVVKGRNRAADGRLLLAATAGGILFVPWVPSFLFQVRHTGTPWAEPAGPAALWSAAVAWAGDSGPVSCLLIGVLVLITLVALTPPGRVPAAIAKYVRSAPAAAVAPWLLGVCAAGALTLGLLTSAVVGSGFAVRYTAAAVGPALVVVGLGLHRLPSSGRLIALATVVSLGLGIATDNLVDDRRSQAFEVATAIQAAIGPADAVVYCPDQLGPSTSRLLPTTTRQLAYPTLNPPQLVDWVDYAQRNAGADPDTIAERIGDTVPGAVWIVYHQGYLTFSDQCEQLVARLSALRGTPTTLVSAAAQFYERATLLRFPAGANS
jgi:mannosyltransferase